MFIHQTSFHVQILHLPAGQDKRKGVLTCCRGATRDFCAIDSQQFSQWFCGTCMYFMLKFLPSLDLAFWGSSSKTANRIKRDFFGAVEQEGGVKKNKKWVHGLVPSLFSRRRRGETRREHLSPLLFYSCDQKTDLHHIQHWCCFAADERNNYVRSIANTPSPRLMMSPVWKHVWLRWWVWHPLPLQAEAQSTCDLGWSIIQPTCSRNAQASATTRVWTLLKETFRLKSEHYAS